MLLSGFKAVPAGGPWSCGSEDASEMKSKKQNHAAAATPWVFPNSNVFYLLVRQGNHLEQELHLVYTFEDKE